MAKPQKQSNTLFDRKSTSAKSPAGKAPAAGTAGKPPQGKAVKAPASKSPPVKARTGKSVPPKPAAPKGGKPPVTELPRSLPRKGSSTLEQPPATEAQIVEALAGKLSTPATGSRAGLSWLASPPKSLPEVVEPPSIPEPAPVVEEVIIADVVVAEVKVEEPANLNLASPKVEEPPPEPITEAPQAEVPIVEEPIVEQPKAEEPKAAADENVTPDLKEWLFKAAANEQSLSTRIKATAGRIGWSLAVQAALFVAFCVMAAKDAPLSGLQSFLRGGIPLFAMILICIDLTSLGGAQRMLDTLESERLAFQRLQRMLPDPRAGTDLEAKPDSFAAARRLAYLPSLVVMGILLVVWLVLGLTVWFL